MRLHKKLLLVAAATGLSASLLALPTATPALADPPVQQPIVSSIGTFLPQYLHANGDGSVTGSYCDSTANTSTYAQTMLSNGYIAGAAKRQNYGDLFPATCDLASMTTGTDGTLYAVLHQFTNGGSSISTQLAAFKNGERLWIKRVSGCESTITYEPAVDGSGQGDGEIYYPTLGYDNTLYVVATEPAQCGTPYRRLVAINTATGAEKHYTRLDAPQAGQGVQYAHIFPAVDGVAVLDGTTVKFADNSGTLVASKTHNLSTVTGGQPQQIINAVGTSTG